MKKFVMAISWVGFIAAGVGLRLSYAGEADILLQKLVEKGVAKGSPAAKRWRR